MSEFRSVLGLLSLGIAWVFASCLTTPAQTAGRSLLEGAWTPDEVGLLAASGLKRIAQDPFDIQLLDAIGERAGIGFALRPMERTHIDESLRLGTLDFALPAIVTQDKEASALISRPYGTRSDHLFVRMSAPASAAQGTDLLLDALLDWYRGIRALTRAASSTSGAQEDFYQ